MKITNKNAKYVKFDTVLEGDVFEYASTYYIKTDERYGGAFKDECSNAVNLTTGEHTYFVDTNTVNLIDCELVIK